MIDPDEMPKEELIKSLKQDFQESGSDLILVPTTNLHPGFTQEWLDKCNFKVNEMDWINWPDYQGRSWPINSLERRTFVVPSANASVGARSQSRTDRCIYRHGGSRGAVSGL